MRRRVGAWLGLLMWLSVVGPLAAQGPAAPDVRFGFVLVSPAAPWPARAVAAGAGSNRYQLNWWDVEPQPGQREWSLPDREIAALRAAGLDVTVLLHAPPAWAREPGYRWVPANLDLPWDDPNNAWGRFAHDVARRYRGTVRYYEIFNEPDLRAYWDGSPVQYARLLAVAYRAIKAADPEARIIMAGMAYWSNPRFVEEVLQALRDLPGAADEGYFFDVAAWHWYSQADQLYDRVRWAQELLARYGMGDKPIWINETNLPLWGDGPGPQAPTPGFGTPEEQAAFIVQAFVNAFAAGAERVFVFRLDDGAMDQTFGLMRNDGLPRPAYLAYRTTARWLSHASFVTREVFSDAVVTVFRRPTAERVSVVWNTTEAWTTFTLPAVAKDAVLITPDGSSVRLVAEGGRYRFDLPPGRRHTEPDGRRVLVVGGMPVFIVEQDRTPPHVTVEPLPALSAAEELTLKWHVTRPSGAPVAFYEVQVSVDGGPWQPWRTVEEPTATLAGQMGRRYAFRVRAVDVNGLRPPWPPDDQPMAETVVGGAVVGRVVDLFGTSLAGEWVCVAGRCVMTDEAGFFRVDGLPSGQFSVTVLGWDIQTTVSVRAGEETVVSALRPRLPSGWLRNSEFSWDGGWVHFPPDGFRLIRRGDETFARLDAGAQVAQGVLLPPERAATLWIRYRTGGAAVEVRLMLLKPTGGERLLFRDDDTLGRWREVALDMSTWAGTNVVVMVRADGEAGSIDVDTVWLGVPPARRALFLPLVVANTEP
ncbi:MAG: hypothetical protein Q9O62_11585 [Ardenticatenia bacterium]|nr:hypothetical protein [Ardenticatenia bacterium]